MVSATLRVTHELGFGIELRRGRFEIVVDGKTVGSVEDHETFETVLEPRTLLRGGRWRIRQLPLPRNQDLAPLPRVDRH
jgi:hypothetical protein